MSFSKGELVTRISYKHDLLFRVASIHQEKVKLHGEDFRLEADAPAKDLVKVEGRELEKRRKKEIEK
ncbi:sporulation peptidase YabG, partial [Virgibacillus halodenitrificans]|nr:sporulation peptidase YabG [Virgibacillus halodenitrificans]MYL60825.1 sporulation peptidase YabG [Virgibacillus halodenitrificans]